MRDPRIEKLADVLVHYSVGVKKDNLVRITGPAPARPLIVAVFRKVIEAGGHPFIRTGFDVTKAQCHANFSQGVYPPELPARAALETSVPGVFAIGDVRANSTKRVAAAVGEGAAVVSQIHAFLANLPAGRRG